MAVAAIKIVAEIEYDVACAAIVDGGKDNGIDAIYYNSQTKNSISCTIKVEQFPCELYSECGNLRNFYKASKTWCR